jgi:hypothetical protein
MIRRLRPAVVRVTVRPLSLAAVEGGCGPTRRRCQPPPSEQESTCIERCRPTDQRTGSQGACADN